MSSSVNEDIEDLDKLETELGMNFEAWKLHMSKLMKDNEKYRQENHSLQCKLEISSTMQQEMHELQEVLENAANELQKLTDKQIHDLQEKHMKQKNDLLSRLSEMETKNSLQSEEIEKLQREIQELNKTLQSIQNETPVMVEEDFALQEEMANLVSQLLQKDHNIQLMGKSLEDFTNENSQLKEILKETKQNLHEKKEQLENTRHELMGLKRELAETKQKPPSEESKGNSLFAEVEDRRKKMLDQMLVLRKSYHEAKRVVAIKDAEIRSLKIDKSALMRKWEDDKVDSHYRDTKLMEKYKERIAELEQKLQTEKNKSNQLENQINPTDQNFSFFQSMLGTKKNKIDELESKLENVSIQAVLEEEMKHKLSRQLRYWRCKAIASDAQLEAIKSRLEIDPQFNTTDVLKILQQTVEKELDLENTLDPPIPPPKVIEESVITLEQLMKVPNCSAKVSPSTYDNSSLNSSSEDFGNSLCFDGSSVKRESIMFNVREVGSSFKEIQKDPMSSIMKTERKCEDYCKEEIEELEVDKKMQQEATKIIPRSPKCYESNKENETDRTHNGNTLKLKSAFAHGTANLLASTNEPKREKKTLKFADDTVDPPPRTLKREVTPKYPIVFVSNKFMHP
ncbi:protein Spindly [Fopius arisanus]|uniref:Ccdc99_1 protein n=1 Tax=Fopius arisanus TaxID=64838 RepID=A0A0C9QJA1_9HYME|nr:PREDICTED: protein Spindly [Fopius arisanus]